eukprot:10146534-Lingulodinium_polyedra.AAC.1
MTARGRSAAEAATKSLPRACASPRTSRQASETAGHQVRRCSVPTSPRPHKGHAARGLGAM